MTSAANHFTSFRCSRQLRAEIDALRMARAHASGGLPPTLVAVVLEAIEGLLARERTTPPRRRGRKTNR